MQKICGVDVSKLWLDAWAGLESGAGRGAFERFENDAAGIARLAGFARANSADLVVMEASGGMERLAFQSLWEAGVRCALVNPRAVRDFAKAMGFLEKTDRIDAMMIARFAGAKVIKPSAPPSPTQQRLTALVARLRQVTGDLGIQKQRLHTVTEPTARQGLLEVIALFKRQSKALTGEIAAIIDQDPLWAALDKTFRTVKGVADRTVAVVMAELPEIGIFSNKAIAKLAGLAPIADDSGKRKGHRAVRGGRAAVRSILYLIADIARKFDPSLAAFRDKLLKAGKPKMVVRIALARKLLVRLNAKARETRLQFANAY